MAKEFNSWDLGSGLPEIFDATIKDAYFGYDENYQNGENALLKLEVQSDDTEIGEAGAMTLMYPCGGNAWEPKNKGKEIAHESGKPKNFNRNSGVGLLIGAAVGIMGEDLTSRGEATEADLWKGLKFTFERKDFEFKDRTTGETSSYNRMLPTAFLGNGSGKETSAPSQTETPTAADTTVEKVQDTETIPTPLRMKLKALAKDCADHDTFMERAFEEFGTDAEKWESEITSDGEGSIWASARA